MKADQLLVGHCLGAAGTILLVNKGDVRELQISQFSGVHKDGHSSVQTL